MSKVIFRPQVLRGARELEPHDMMPQMSSTHSTQEPNTKKSNFGNLTLPMYVPGIMNDNITQNMAFKERGCKDEPFSRIVGKPQPPASSKKLFPVGGIFPHTKATMGHITPIPKPMPISSNFSASLNSRF